MADFLIEQVFEGKPLDIFVVDAHCHVGECRMTLVDSSVDGLIRMMDRTGTNISVISSTPGSLCGRIKEGNGEVIAAVRRFPERIIGMATIDPFHPEKSLDELKRCCQGDLCGIKIHEQIDLPYDHANYTFAWEFADEHAWPIIAHTWGDFSLDALVSLYDKYPNIKWILAHSGCLVPERYARIACGHSNVFLELCCSLCSRGLVEYFVKQGLVSRLLYGSDAVFMDGAPQIGRVVFAGIATEDKVAILGSNAGKLWNLA